ncbi:MULTISPECIES: LysR family transcriptional regulator [unclassified Paraburkholderia]|uniref:LysR family transcriptional regulator n=1 Tax=unclassified Paraburkholderia TaxID=2615204 RepID=UPI002AB10093|nr:MULTISPECIES: LysR family transcriptional regulator [unclassified Paraburkholderia]
MNVDLNHLRCFVAVAEELHFGRAAARLFMTQPPLSRQIHLLEEALGLVLFERNSRSVKLTEAGRVYYDDALRILRLADQAADSARRVARGDAGQVTVGFTAVSGYQMVPALLSAASEALPGITVVLREMVSLAQTRSLETRAIDLGIMRAQFASPGIACRLLRREPLMAAIPATHRLAKRRTIAARDLEDEAFVMYSPDGGKYFHDRIAGLFNAAGVRVRHVQFIDQTHSIVALVRAGLGVAIVPASAQELGFRDVQFHPLWTADAHADLDLAWSEEQNTPAVERFRDFALDYFSQHAKTRHSA